MLLLDTHALLWFGAADRRLTRRGRSALTDPDETVYVSVVSYWEVELKRRRRRDFVPPEPIGALMARAGFLPLALEFDVPVRLAELPPLHGDPFDRMLVAQALHHGLVIVSSDRAIARYDVPVLW